MTTKLVLEILSVEDCGPRAQKDLRQKLEDFGRGIQDNFGLGFAVFFETGSNRFFVEPPEHVKVLWEPKT